LVVVVIWVEIVAQSDEKVRTAEPLCDGLRVDRSGRRIAAAGALRAATLRTAAGTLRAAAGRGATRISAGAVAPRRARIARLRPGRRVTARAAEERARERDRRRSMAKGDPPRLIDKSRFHGRGFWTGSGPGGTQSSAQVCSSGKSCD